ncbi:SUKH-4 family immunity protein [Streptomyces anandii]|uniref:SUKH-4 family immunity protein n=1 Tax=Streptomyces anandii TaxID=285454 RepID=UPI0036F9AAD1
MSTTGTATAVMTRTGEVAARFAPYAAHRRGSSGLALDLPPRLLEREFGRGRVIRFEEIDFPPTLTHEPTRRFLTETGLPDDPRLLSPDTDIPLPTLTEHHADDPATQLPSRAAHLIHLGTMQGPHTPLLDGTTGGIHLWSPAEATLHPSNEDISTLVHSLVLLHRAIGGRGGNRTRVTRFAGLSGQVRA